MLKPYMEHMKAAIAIAQKHETPFGAALAMGDELYVTAANETSERHDPTAHAEVMAIRKLGAHIKKTDLSGFTLYTTCEPCPMCMSAALWAKIDTVFYGCNIPTITEYMNQIDLRSHTLASSGFKETHVKGEIMLTECEDLLKRYA